MLKNDYPKHSPIYRVIIEYRYRKKNTITRYKHANIDTFVLTNDIELIKKDKRLKEKMIKNQKGRNPYEDIDVVFKKIKTEGPYGHTNY